MTTQSERFIAVRDEALQMIKNVVMEIDNNLYLWYERSQSAIFRQESNTHALVVLGQGSCISQHEAV
jgi:hypothetical protein